MNTIKVLSEKCDALERAAGISKEMERAREGRFIPLGALGDPATPDEYFADEHDHLREKTRDAYFSVQDIQLRKQLIAAALAVDAAIDKSYDADLAEAKKAQTATAALANNQPWFQAAVLSVAAVAVGYWLFGLVGALGGAVGGFFLGQGSLANARAKATATLAEATQQLDQLLQDRQTRALHPPIFSSLEQATGTRDEKLDRESAYANVVQRQRGG